jgi:hypothetical protein
MSGPTTVLFSANPLAVILAAAGIRAALAVQAGYAEAAQLQQENQDRNNTQQSLQATSAGTGQQALSDEASAAEAALDQLSALAQKLGIESQVRATRPLRPEVSSMALSAYVRSLQGLAAQLRTILLTEAARQSAEFADMPEFSPQAAIKDWVPQNLSQRLLARIAHLGAPPEQLQQLAQELAQTLPGERFDLLASELRAQIQAHIEALQKQQVQEATALVVTQSLKDLGYQVEEVADTLFVEGGVLHFRKPGWSNYMVRMRVDAKASSANFNVVRAVAQGENERSVLDHLAEDRWCAEFPALLQALEARGLHLNVTRRLEAGEVPVQLVDAAKLPRFADEEVNIPHATLLARKLP